MLGIKVTPSDDKTQVVSSQPDLLSEAVWGPSRAGLLFSMLARYRLVDVLALLSGVDPYPAPVPRSPAPLGFIKVRQPLRDFSTVHRSQAA
jgi:hypothetical protein